MPPNLARQPRTRSPRISNGSAGLAGAMAGTALVWVTTLERLIPSATFAITYLMIVPMAMPVLTLIVVVSSVYLILLHSGFEIFPRGTAEHWLGRWIVTPTCHQMHHELFTENLGLCFTRWDRLLGTSRTATQRVLPRYFTEKGALRHLPAIIEGDAASRTTCGAGFLELATSGLRSNQKLY